jgi:hypothetical protein
MTFDEATNIVNLLKEADFNVLNLSENPEEMEMYYTATEMARRIDVRLDSETMSKALLELGYKAYQDKVGLPTNPENSAIALKFSEDDTTGIKDYYIQCLWSKEELFTINKAIMGNYHFHEKKEELREKNKKTVSDLLNSFLEMEQYIVINVKKTGFNLKYDFILYLSYAIYNKSTNGIVSSGYLLIDDDLDDDKTERYTTKNEITDMSPFDYIKLQLPTMDDCNFRHLFLPRIDALRKIYSLTKGKNIVFYNDQEEKFINKLFDKEDLNEEYKFSYIKNRTYFFKDLIDWLEPKESFKIRDVYRRYQINTNKGEGFQKDALMLNEAIFKVLNKYKNLS